MTEMSRRPPRWVGVVLIVLVGLTAAVLVALERRYRKVDKRLRELEHHVANLAGDDGPLESLRTDMNRHRDAFEDVQDEADIRRRELLEATLAEQVERLVEGADDDQERCLRLARWVAGHISNRWEPSGDGLRTFATRSGYCRARTDLFIRMCALLHIPAQVLNIYNFSENMGGHSCVQAWYDGAWHLFDVTYAGVFMHEGQVLSWEQMCADPEKAMAGMVVFEQTLDRWSGTEPAGARVNNARRMRNNWSAEVLRRTANSSGFLGSPNPKWLVAAVDLGESRAVTLGQIDGEVEDVSSQGMRQRISSYLGHSLGTAVDTFHTQWRLTGGRPGDTWVIRYRLCNASHAELAFWARSAGGQIVTGQTFEVSESLANGESAVWEIRVRLDDQGAATVRVGYDFRADGRLASVDQIQIVPHAEP